MGDGHTPIAAMCKAYTLWCEANGVRHRRLDSVPFLACLELDHGIVAGKCYWTVDDEPRSTYALKGVRFKVSQLNKLRKDREKDSVGDYLEAHLSLAGRSHPDAQEAETDENEQRRKRREYYLKNKDRIKARRRERR